MAAFSHREGVLLSFYHPISAPRSPDVDFHDVFGGPPRRASIQETRFGEAKDAFEFGEDDAISHRRQRWSGLSERPVFGEEGVNRRRNGREGFFDDIFGGNDSSSSSPRDPSNSHSSSRILSPGRPISSRFSEPLTSSSRPSQSSVPRKSINRHKNRDGISPRSRFSSQVRDDTSNSASSKSSLSRETSPMSKESEILERPEKFNKDKNLKKDSTDSRVQSTGHQFHFSIYRWASKKMPLPCRGGRDTKMIEPYKLEKSSSPYSRIACEGMPKVSPAGTETQFDSDTVSSDADSCEIERANSKSSSNVSEGKNEPVEDESPVDSNFQDLKAEKKALRRNSKTLHSLFSGNNGAKEREENEINSTKKSSAAGEKQSKQDPKRMQLNNEETGKADIQGTCISSQDKIKEFLKIYDQATSEPSKLKEVSQSRSFRWKDVVKIRAPNDRILPTPNLYEDLPRVIATEKVDAFPKKPEKLGSPERTNNNKPTERTNNNKPTDISLDSEGRSASTAGSTRNGSEARDDPLGDSFHLNIQITELSQDENGLKQAGNIEDETREIDANIRKWSQGKQGNIRSLLSTLQFVLWPESGWKPVPLVDIIESNAVKKSYQKALLSLHPDKLQQKGATSNQKYIAEKVFDILQEAWTHFNTLGSV